MSTTTKKNVLENSEINADNVHIGDNVNRIVSGKIEFSEINLEAYEEEEYVYPFFTGQLVQKVMKSTHHILVLTGFYGFDKASFTKHLAVRIVEKELEDNGRKLIAKECSLVSDFYGITSAIKESEEDCIFIMNNLRPKDVNHNLGELRKVVGAHAKTIYLLASTNLPFSAWKNTNENYWYDIQPNGLYHKKVSLYKETFIYRKTDLRNYIRKSLNVKKFKDYREKLLEVVGKTINVEISTPEQYNVFLDLFEKEPSKDEKDIQGLIKQTNRKDALIKNWFYALSEQQKMIVLGMTLLEGLYVDQFFAIMERFMLKSWKPFDDSARALDFSDLDSLMHFFYFTLDKEPILNAKFPGQRFITLQTVWQHYSRRIIAVLPELVNLVTNSVGTVSDWELYGSREKREKLREVVASILSEVGRLSPKSVEQALLTLAANDSEGVQVVAAKALANWRASYEDKSKRQKNNEAVLFKLLHGWHKNHSYSDMLKVLMQLFNLSGELENKDSYSSYIRSTIILTLGYSAVYDEPNKLKSDIVKLLKELVKEGNDNVINRLGITLRILLRNHPKQIGEELFDLDTGIKPILSKAINIEQYINKIAYGLVDAHKDYPMIVEQIIEDWYNYCDANRRINEDPKKMDYREKILCVVIMALSLIDHDQAKVYDLKNAIKILEQLRKVEHGDYVRRLLLKMLLVVSERHMTEHDLLGSKAIPNMTPEERIGTVQELRGSYLRQRNKMKGGDYRICIDSKHWMDSWVDQADRDDTPAEGLVKNWLDNKNETIVNIAVQSLMEFIKIESKEEAEIEKILKEKEEKNKHQNTNIPKRDYGDKIKKGFWDRFLIRDEVAQLVIALAKQDGEMEKNEIKLLAKKLESYKKHKAAKALQGIYVQWTT